MAKIILSHVLHDPTMTYGNRGVLEIGEWDDNSAVAVRHEPLPATVGRPQVPVQHRPHSAWAAPSNKEKVWGDFAVADVREVSCCCDVFTACMT